MRYLGVLGLLFSTLHAFAQTPPAALWDELKDKREKSPGIHQEFDLSQTYIFAHGRRSLEERLVMDSAGKLWREKSVSGSGNEITLFDGDSLLTMQEGEDEFTKTKRRANDDDPAPSPYRVQYADWQKAVELERRPCGLPGSDHACAVLDVPLKPWIQSTTGNSIVKNLGGSERMVIDTQTGLLLSVRTIQDIDHGSGGYTIDRTYMLRRFAYGVALDAGLLKLPSGDMREVKELSRWNAARIKKELAGNPAPDLALTDIHGKPLKLSDAKGKTVLLDFWTTWCPPCRADSPALDKLYQKYGQQDLLIVGISVSEERATVEKFLSEHPHSFPVALTTENAMPRAYRIGAFPTYIVINRDGTVASAVEGEKGFADLRKLLKKAGLEVD